jgi:TRAP-type C4-dicarboxylate transport system substrate-binding protein
MPRSEHDHVGGSRITVTCRLHWVLIATGLCISSVACSDPPGKTGGPIVPIALRATPTGLTDTPGRDLLEGIREKAGLLSNGAVTIAVGDLPSGDQADDQDGAAIQSVRDGGSDLAVVRAAAFSAVGDTEFAALQAPFLIDNEEQAARVAADPIADEMLASLGQIGLVGLAVAPSGLRHPVGWNTPLVALSDYRGATINTRPGIEIDRLFAAFGAKTDHSVGDERIAAAGAGTLRGIEVSLLQTPIGGAPATMTANVVLYTKFDVVIVNRKVYDGLSRTQRDVLRRAVSIALPDTLAARPSEAAAHATWCARDGVASVLASQSELADLKNASKSVITDLERDTFTKRAIGQIQALTIGTTQVALAPCSGPVLEPSQVVAAGDQSGLDGTWRWETTRQDLLDAGVPTAEVEKDVGVYTFVLRNGELSGDTPTGRCYGAYKINGNRFAWAWVADGLCGGDFEGRFTRKGDHLTFTFGPNDQNAAFYRGVFKGGLVRIGDVP